MRRGEVWWVDFGLPFGSEPGYRRPAVIVQAGAFNKSRLALSQLDEGLRQVFDL